MQTNRRIEMMKNLFILAFVLVGAGGFSEKSFSETIVEETLESEIQSHSGVYGAVGYVTALVAGGVGGGMLLSDFIPDNANDLTDFVFISSMVGAYSLTGPYIGMAGAYLADKTAAVTHRLCKKTFAD